MSRVGRASKAEALRRPTPTSGAASLAGGDGKNVLAAGLPAGATQRRIPRGGSGPNVLLGGPGDDLLVGNAADDILIAGTTARDGNEAAVAAEWTRSDRTYQQRVDAVINGGGLNGTVVLNAATGSSTASASRDRRRRRCGRTRPTARRSGARSSWSGG